MSLSFGDQRSERMKEIDAMVKQRVMAGMRLLQAEYGEDWVDRINLDELDLHNVNTCVLGQVYGVEGMDEESGYLRGRKKLGFLKLEDEGVSRHGFYVSSEDYKINYDDPYCSRDDEFAWMVLQKEWEDQIVRLQKGVVSAA
jgi:hypothetical protein